jgi:TRAP-type C4-dicarboxylate transport system permease small subunit
MIKLLERFKNSFFWKLLVRFQEVLLVLSSIFVVLIMCTEVVLRYIFHSDFFGIEEVVIVAAFWLYFIGSSYGVYEKSHVKADIIPQLLSERARALLSVVISFTMSVLSIVFSWWAFGMVCYAIEWMPRTTGLRIPVFISQSSIFFGYCLMSLYSVVHFLEDFFLFILPVERIIESESLAE